MRNGVAIMKPGRWQWLHHGSGGIGAAAITSAVLHLAVAAVFLGPWQSLPGLARLAPEPAIQTVPLLMLQAAVVTTENLPVPEYEAAEPAAAEPSPAEAPSIAPISASQPTNKQMLPSSPTGMEKPQHEAAVADTVLAMAKPPGILPTAKPLPPPHAEMQLIAEPAAAKPAAAKPDAQPVTRPVVASLSRPTGPAHPDQPARPIETSGKDLNSSEEGAGILWTSLPAERLVQQPVGKPVASARPAVMPLAAAAAVPTVQPVVASRALNAAQRQQLIAAWGKAVRARIDASRRVMRYRGRAVVVLTIASTGRLDSVRLTASSGNPAADRAVLRMMRSLGDLPPAPKGLDDAAVDFRIAVQLR